MGERRLLVARSVGGGGPAAWRPIPMPVVLVPAGREHNAFFLACRNDADAVRHSRSQRPIGRAEHARWFAAVIDDPGVRLRVGMLAR